MDYTYLIKFSGFEYADEPVLFNQRVGHCFAHCMLWIGYVLGDSPGGYWGELLRNGATSGRVKIGDSEITKISAVKGGDPLAGTLQGLAMSDDLKKDFEQQAAWASSAIKPTMSPSSRAKIPDGCDHKICTDSDPREAIKIQKAWLFCLHKLTYETAKTSAAGGAGIGLTLEGGARFTHHAVATMMYQGKFWFFDPNCGQFSVHPKHAEDLVEAWWDDVQPEPPNGLGYRVYNKTESLRSTVAGQSGGALD